MRAFYDFMIRAATATTSFSVAVSSNNLLRYYPATQKFLIVLLILLIPVFGFAVYTPRFRVLGIVLLTAFFLGVLTAWLT